MLKPLEVYGKKFSKGFRGYESEEVDKFFAQIAKDFETLYEENIQLKEDAEVTKAKLEQYQQLEKTMQNTLLIAQTTAEEIKTGAGKEKDFIIKEAEMKAKQILTDIELDAQKKKQQLQNEIDEKAEELLNVKKNIKRGLTKVKEILEDEMALINDDGYIKNVFAEVADIEKDEAEKEAEKQEAQENEADDDVPSDKPAEGEQDAAEEQPEGSETSDDISSAEKDEKK